MTKLKKHNAQSKKDCQSSYVMCGWREEAGSNSSVFVPRPHDTEADAEQATDIDRRQSSR